MWKVLAADDESYIREALQKLINWEKMDCSLEKVVSDGQELLDGITRNILMPVLWLALSRDKERRRV